MIIPGLGGIIMPEGGFVLPDEMDFPLDTWQNQYDANFNLYHISQGTNSEYGITVSLESPYYVNGTKMAEIRALFDGVNDRFGSDDVAGFDLNEFASSQQTRSFFSIDDNVSSAFSNDYAHSPFDNRYHLIFNT